MSTYFNILSETQWGGIYNMPTLFILLTYSFIVQDFHFVFSNSSSWGKKQLFGYCKVRTGRKAATISLNEEVSKPSTHTLQKKKTIQLQEGTLEDKHPPIRGCRLLFIFLVIVSSCLHLQNLQESGRIRIEEKTIGK